MVRVELALASKAIVEARAKANQVASGDLYGKGSKVPLNSAEPIEPIETRQVIATMAGVGKDTVRKVEVFLRPAWWQAGRF